LVGSIVPEGQKAMKKLSDFHNDNKVLESESPVTSLPNPSLGGSKPKGVMDREHPGRVSRGAAESRVDPVRDVKQTGSNARDRKH
jgi:hypothetical protein